MMKKLLQSKFIFWSIIVIVLVIYGKFMFLNPYLELAQLKDKLSEQEKQIVKNFKNHNNITNLIANLNVIRQLEDYNSDDKGADEVFQKMISPKYSKVNLNIYSEHKLMHYIEYPIHVEMKSSFNNIGDYLEHLESLYPPILIQSITLTPSIEEFEFLSLQLTGKIYLPIKN